MTAISIILGVLMVIGGFSCMFTPLATFLYTGYFIGIMLLVYGIAGIIRGIQKQADTIEVVLSVLALIVGLISLFRPGSTLIFDGMMIYLIAAWFLIQGIGSIVMAVNTRKENNLWVLGLIVGILGVVLGLYSFAHPVLTAVTGGILIGFYFVQAGFDMIALGIAIGSAKKNAR